MTHDQCMCTSRERGLIPEIRTCLISRTFEFDSTKHLRFSRVMRLVYVCVLFSSLPIEVFQWPITSSVTLTFNLTQLFLQQLRFTSLAVFIPTHPVNFPVGGNRSARRKPTTFGRVLTVSFRTSGALGSSNIEKVLSENRTRDLRGERRAL